MSAPAKQRAPVVPLLFKLKGAAEFLGVSRTEFWKLSKAGVIPPGAMLPGQTRGQVWHRDQLAEVADRLVKP